MGNSFLSKYLIKITSIAVLLLLVVVASCVNQKEPIATADEAKEAFDFGVWITANDKKQTKNTRLNLKNTKMQVLTKY